MCPASRWPSSTRTGSSSPPRTDTPTSSPASRSPPRTCSASPPTRRPSPPPRCCSWSRTGGSGSTTRWRDHLDFLAGAPAGRVTVREVLAHGSGLVRDGWDGDFWQLFRSFPDRAGLERISVDAADVLGRNERFKYSNIGFGLLGLVIEAVTGSSYEAHIAARITGPLGLADTGPELDPASRLRGRDRVRVAGLPRPAPAHRDGPDRGPRLGHRLLLDRGGCRPLRVGPLRRRRAPSHRRLETTGAAQRVEGGGQRGGAALRARLRRDRDRQAPPAGPRRWLPRAHHPHALRPRRSLRGQRAHQLHRRPRADPGRRRGPPPGPRGGGARLGGRGPPSGSAVASPTSGACSTSPRWAGACTASTRRWPSRPRIGVAWRWSTDDTLRIVDAPGYASPGERYEIERAADGTIRSVRGGSGTTSYPIDRFSEAASSRAAGHAGRATASGVDPRRWCPCSCWPSVTRTLGRRCAPSSAATHASTGSR